MYIALDLNGNRVYIDSAEKNAEYFCPVCHGRVIVKDGNVNAKHFAHESLIDCDDFSVDMSEWHMEWQAQFPTRNREVVIEHNGEKHRADVLACGYVVEFQHSPITASEFERRNEFYLSTGRKVIWVFDFSSEMKNGQINCYEEWSSKSANGGKFKWISPKRFMKSYIPQFHKKVIVFFQFINTDFTNEEEFYIERVTWAIESNGESDFRRFCTDYMPANKTELIQWIKERKF